MVHLVYCDNKEKQLPRILDGTIKMIIRAATGRKIPHGRVFADEKLYFMEKGSSIITLSAIVKCVQNYQKLSEDQIDNVLAKNQDKLALSKMQQIRWHKQCICLIEFENVQSIEPLHFEHQGNMDDWLILEKIEDVLIGTSVPYHYDKSKL